MRCIAQRPFFNDLVDFMISGPVMIQVLEGDNAIAKNRELMGATDPKKADAGTIRADFARVDRRQRRSRLRCDRDGASRDRVFFPSPQYLQPIGRRHAATAAAARRARKVAPQSRAASRRVRPVAPALVPHEGAR